MQSLGLEIRLLGARFHSGDRVAFDLLHDVEVLDENFDLAGTIPVLADCYDVTSFGLIFRAAQRREVSAEMGIYGGEFWDGTRTDYDACID